MSNGEAPKLDPGLMRTGKTAEIAIQAAKDMAHTRGGAAVWWIAAVLAGVGPQLLGQLDELTTWSAIFAPRVLIPILCSAAGVIMGIAGPAPRDIRGAAVRSLGRLVR
jgi:hypothetical protein